MQFIEVLRGCFVAYLGAVLVTGCGMAIDGIFSEMPVVPIAYFFVMIALYGVLIAAVAAVPVFILWLIFAARRLAIPYWAAPLFGGVEFGLAFGAMNPTAVSVSIGTVCGSLLGLVFWVGAFGWQRRVQMGWRVS